MATKLGSELKVGDTIATWFSGGRDTIIALRPYTGPLAHLFPAGASLADFAHNKSGMTIEHDHSFDVIATMGV